MKQILVIDNNSNMRRIAGDIPQPAAVNVLNGNNRRTGTEVTNEIMATSFLENRNINRYKKKQIIYAEGNHPLHLYYIKKGIVKTYKCNGEGKELITGIYGEGDYLGYVALLQKNVYRDFAVAVEYAELALIPKDEFELMMSTSRHMATKFINLLAESIAEKEEMLVGLAYNSLRKKVADALLLLNKKYKNTIKISRDNIAAIAGTATESLIRTLGEFRQEKLIDINDGIIIILNESRLKKMMN